MGKGPQGRGHGGAPPAGSSSSAAAAAAAHQYNNDYNSGRAPLFDNTVNGYREYRKKVEIYAARMAVSGKEETVGLDILGGLRGKAWDATEDLAIDQVSTAKGWQTILTRLDHVLKFDSRTELPSEFENLSLIHI